MFLAIDLRRQARVCTRLPDNSEDHHLAEPLKAFDHVAKADDFEGLPSERLRHLSGHQPTSAS
jgi:hypothetical protein